MKIVIRHEGASEQEVEQTCVWIVGDDGETVGTEYLKPGEQVDVDVSGSASIDASFCEVGQINAPTEEEPPAPEDPPPAPSDESASTSGDGASSSSDGGASGEPGAAPSGGEAAGGEAAPQQ